MESNRERLVVIGASSGAAAVIQAMMRERMGNIILSVGDDYGCWPEIERQIPYIRSHGGHKSRAGARTWSGKPRPYKGSKAAKRASRKGRGK